MAFRTTAVACSEYMLLIDITVHDLVFPDYITLYLFSGSLKKWAYNLSGFNKYGMLSLYFAITQVSKLYLSRLQPQ